MDSTNTGGPAFPASEFFDTGDGTDQRLYGRHTGMTLRDYFAAKAMQAFLDQVGWKSDQKWFDEIADGAYRMADAMLKARVA